MVAISVVALAWVFAGFAPFDEVCFNDECISLNDAALFARTGRLLSSWHWETALVAYGIEHGGVHSSGYQAFLGPLSRVLGGGIEGVWRWNALFHLAAVAGLAWVWAGRLASGRGRRRAAAIVALGGLALPTAWAYVDFATSEPLLLTLAVLSAWAWLAYLEQPGLRRFSLFAALCAAATLLREVEIARFVLGAALAWWLTGRRRSILAAATAWGVATLSAFAWLNPLRQPVGNPVTDAFRDGSVIGGLATGAVSVSQLVTAIWRNLTLNLSIFIDPARHQSFADLWVLPWVAALVVIAGWALRVPLGGLFASSREARVRMKARPDQAQTLAIWGGLTALVVTAASFALYEASDLRPVRMAHTGVLTLLLGLAGLAVRAETAFGARAVSLAATVTGLALGAWLYLEYGAWSEPRGAQGSVLEAERLLLASGAANRSGEQVIFYDFSSLRRWGIDHALALQYRLNLAVRAGSTDRPFYRLAYVGFEGSGDAPAALSKLKALGLCPVFAVLERGDASRVGNLEVACGKYERIGVTSGVFWDALTKREHYVGWTAQVYRKTGG